MAYKSRVDKSGRTVYAYRYSYIDEEGKKHDTNTSYFLTKEEAETEGMRLKRAREEEVKHGAQQRRDKSLETAFQEYIDYLEGRANRRTTENNSTDIGFYHRAITIKKKYMPAGVKRVKVREIEPIVFRDWITYINGMEISGSYVRNIKAVISSFNRWLRDNGYYFTNRNLDMEIAFVLSNTTLKPKKTMNRELKGERNIVSASDVDRICNYFYEQGIGEFENFYFYTLYYVLFYSGVRVEEIVGLQWKFVDLDVYGEIRIENAINQRENRKNVMERIMLGIYHTKNQTSIRVLPILENYRELLKDYRTSYRNEYGIQDDKELNECFVFPMLVKHNPHIYMNSDFMTKKLKIAIRELGIKNTDCQMFRHSCATFLIMPYPEGLGFSEQEVIDYFGHADEEMLRTVYARLNKKQKAERMKITFGDYYKMEKTDKAKEEEKKQLERIELMKGKTDIPIKAREGRIFAEIERAMENGYSYYIYNKKDRDIIDKYINSKDEIEIEFVEEK